MRTKSLIAAVAAATLVGSPALPVAASQITRYKYDARGRLYSVDERNPAGSGRLVGYVHDNADNRTIVQVNLIVRSVKLPSATTLLRGQAVLSSDGNYVLVMQYDGNLVLYNADGTPIWATPVFNYTVSRLEMQSDGNLVTYDVNGQPVWSTNTFGSPGGYMNVQVDGKIAVYSAAGAKLWSSS